MATKSQSTGTGSALLGLRGALNAIQVKSPKEYIQEFRDELELKDRETMEETGEILRRYTLKVPAGSVRVQFFIQDYTLWNQKDPDIERVVALESDGSLNLAAIKEMWGLENIFLCYLREPAPGEPHGRPLFDKMYPKTDRLNGKTVKYLIQPRNQHRGWAAEDPEDAGKFEQDEVLKGLMMTPIIIMEGPVSPRTRRRRQCRAAYVRFVAISLVFASFWTTNISPLVSSKQAVAVVSPLKKTGNFVASEYQTLRNNPNEFWEKYWIPMLIALVLFALW